MPGIVHEQVDMEPGVGNGRLQAVDFGGTRDIGGDVERPSPEFGNLDSDLFGRVFEQVVHNDGGATSRRAGVRSPGRCRDRHP